jgi:hypothetical protein
VKTVACCHNIHDSAWAAVATARRQQHMVTTTHGQHLVMGSSSPGDGDGGTVKPFLRQSTPSPLQDDMGIRRRRSALQERHDDTAMATRVVFWLPKLDPC